MGAIVIKESSKSTAQIDQNWKWHSSQVLFGDRMSIASPAYEASFSDFRTNFGRDVRNVLRTGDARVLDLLSYGAGLVGLSRQYEFKGISLAKALPGTGIGGNEELPNLGQVFGDIFAKSTWKELEKSMQTLGITNFNLVFCRGQGAMGNENRELPLQYAPYRDVIQNIAQVLAPNCLIFSQLPSDPFIRRRILRLLFKFLERKSLDVRYIDPIGGPGSYYPVRVKLREEQDN